jgi:hypothetical protein
MRGRRSLIAVPAAALALLAASAAPRTPARAPAGPAPLRPLSAADESRAADGCSCTFLVGSGRRSADLLYMSGHLLLSRTRAGLDLCPISEAQFQAISGRGGSADCGGRRIAIRNGQAAESGEDSWSADATLAVTQGGRTRLVHGTWACAC